jgi:hypothetical protein
VLCHLVGLKDQADCFDLAVRAHRAAQGGRGSGYDVAASWFGGLGLFRGGSSPEFERVEADWLPPLSLYETGAPASTAHAISRYAAWKTAHPEAAREFLCRSNGLISALLRRRSWREAEPVARELADTARELGRNIGVSAEIRIGRETPVAVAGSGANGPDDRPPAAAPRPHRDMPMLCKAVGAGAELAVCFGTETVTGGESTEGLMPVEVDVEGCTWS